MALTGATTNGDAKREIWASWFGSPSAGLCQGDRRGGGRWPRGLETDRCGERPRATCGRLLLTLSLGQIECFRSSSPGGSAGAWGEREPGWAPRPGPEGAPSPDALRPPTGSELSTCLPVSLVLTLCGKRVGVGHLATFPTDFSSLLRSLPVRDIRHSRVHPLLGAPRALRLEHISPTSAVLLFSTSMPWLL